MSRILLVVAIDDLDAGAQAAKEAAAMALEPLGRVHVLRVKVEAPEQLELAPNSGAGRR